MAVMIVRHRVANFEVWKAVFDEAEASRRKHGWLGYILLRDAKEPHLLTIINRVRSVADAQAYAGSDALRSAMQRAGVQGPPDIQFLENIEEKSY